LAVAIRETVNGMVTCGQAIKDASAKMNQEPARARLLRADQRAHLTVQSLLKYPQVALRQLDLSRPVVRGIIVIGEEIDDATAKLAQSLGPFQGLARILVDRLAAMAMASVFDKSLDELEERSLAAPTSVARSACEVYRQAASRPL